MHTKLYYDMQVNDVSTGKVVRKTRKKICHSFVRQFLDILHATMVGDYTSVVTSFTGAVYNIPGPGNLTPLIFDATGAAGDTSQGTVVGTSVTTATVLDYKLGTIIPHGTASGQLQYSAETFGAPTYDATSSYCVLTRVFTNGSSATISVNEIGLYCTVPTAGVYVPTFCIIHDSLASADTAVILNGQALTLNYTVKATI